MIDLGQYLTARDASDARAGRQASWATQTERQLKWRALETDSPADWAAYHAIRRARLATVEA